MKNYLNSSMFAKSIAQKLTLACDYYFKNNYGKEKKKKKRNEEKLAIGINIKYARRVINLATMCTN